MFLGSLLSLVGFLDPVLGSPLRYLVGHLVVLGLLVHGGWSHPYVGPSVFSGDEGPIQFRRCS